MRTRSLTAALLLAGAMLITSGCSNWNDDEESTQTAYETGIFLDSAVAGLGYTCTPSGRSGTTDANGHYHYEAGDSVQFFMGQSPLGPAAAAKGFFFPTDIFGDAPTNPSARALNLMRTLQTLDSDGNVSNGIALEGMENFTASGTLDFSSNESILPIIQTVKAEMTDEDIVPADEALENFEATLQEVTETGTQSSSEAAAQSSSEGVSSSTDAMDDSSASSVEASSSSEHSSQSSSEGTSSSAEIIGGSSSSIFSGYSSSNGEESSSSENADSSDFSSSASSVAPIDTPLEIAFSGIDVPLSDATQEVLQTTTSVSVEGSSQMIGFTKLMKTSEQDNGETFGLVKDYQDEPILFEDESAYICNGTNLGVGSGLDHSSILQRNDKLYMVSQFECQLGVMYMFELNQDTDGALSAKPGTLTFISQQEGFGGFVHCAGQTTPWQSHLGSEEYEIDARMVEESADADGFTGDDYYDEVAKYWGGDATAMSPYYYGWTPEVAIDDAGAPVYAKHFSMGRFSHELAYVMPDRKTVYMSDDGTNVGLFMFIADVPEDLSAGTLYAAKLTQTETYQGGTFTITWINLGHATDADIKAKVAQKPTFSDMFETQVVAADNTCGTGFTPINASFGAECLKVKEGMELYASRLETRRYAAILGATVELRKEEGITYDPVHNKLYVAMSEINQGMEDNKKYGVDNDTYDKAGPNHIKLPDNTCGALYALDLLTSATDTQGDAIGSETVASTMYALITGEAADYVGTAYEGNSCNVDKIANPDNITYIGNSNTIIIGEDSGAHKNNMVWAYNVETGELSRIATTPFGAETTSPFWHRDINGFSYLTLVTQHPNAGDKESFVGVIGPVQGATASFNETGGYVGEIKVPDYTVPGPGDIEGEKPPCYTTGDSLVFKSNFECASLLPWKIYSAASDANWEVSSYGGKYYAYISGYADNEPSEDWLISPKFELSGDEVLTFVSAKGYSGSDVVLKISTDFSGSGDPALATWTDLPATFASSEGGNYIWTDSGDVDLSTFSGTAYIAFYHKAPGTASGEVANWEIDDIVITGSGQVIVPFEADLSVDSANPTTITEVGFSATVSGGSTPYSYAWNFGDGGTSSEEAPTYTYAASGTYTVTLNVTDNAEATATATYEISVAEPLDEAVPALAGDLRIATFNAYLNRTELGALEAELDAGTNQQIKNVAEILQHVNADIVLLNEFDYYGNAQVETFINDYLKVPQGISASGVDYPYYYTAPVNTGLQPDTPQDFNNDGITGGPDDAYGYGDFEGQYGMVVLSKYPIETDAVRTFQKFLWDNMPDALWPTNDDGSQWYSDSEKAIFRLSSKSHWDIPVNVDGTVVHVLTAHPTPPTFDGTEDRNGKRNHDEIRLWADYVSGNGSYLYDDAGTTGGLGEEARFVILGDYNADPDEGDSYDNAIMQFLNNDAINASFTPTSEGAVEDGSDADDTANWDMRADYVLPSTYGFIVNQGGVFWPKKNDIKQYLVEELSDGGEASSDHRLVWIDLAIAESTPVVTVTEDFEQAILGEWATYNRASDKNWEVASYSNNYYAYMNGYGATDDILSDDWLISPAIELGHDQVLNFKSASNYTGPDVKVMISTDYSGSGDPSDANWTELTAQLSPGSWTWTDSGSIDLSAYTGTGYIAFHYTSGETGSAAWEIDNISITVASITTDFEDQTLGLWKTLDLASDKSWNVASYSGNSYAYMNGYGATDDILSDDWLISPAILFNGSQSLQFTSASNYTGPDIKVVVSTDYAGSGDPSDANWTELTAQLSPGSWTWTDSGSIDLSDFNGIGYIGFHYMSDETGSAAWEVDDILFGND